METTPITINSGVSWRGEYIDIQDDYVGVDLSNYDLQMQVINTVDRAVLATPTITKDSTVDGRIWPNITAAKATELYGESTVWVLLMRPTDLSLEPRLIAGGTLRTQQGASWA